MKFWNNLRKKWLSLKKRLRLRLWLKLLECCEKLTKTILLDLWQDSPKILQPPQEQQLRAWEDLSLSLPQAKSLVSQSLEAEKS
jgi:hypothetical protein